MMSWELGILALGMVVIGVIVMLVSLRLLLSDDISPRLKTYVADEMVNIRQLQGYGITTRRELTGGFMTRTLVPLFKWVGNQLGRLTPVAMEESIRRQLVAAGNPLNIGPREYFGIRILFIVVGVVLAWVVLSKGFNRNNFLIALLAFIVCVLLPVYWLRMLVSSRQNKIRRGLPDAMDMLSVCADAGLGFDQSLQRVSEYWRTPVGLEFGRVVAEMEMGLSRREALRNMADRLDVSELSSFVSVILQSEQMGMSIADVLHAQAEQMRVERHYRAQEIARTIPIKMLVPLAFLIFPAIMAVLLGPAIPQILDVFKML